MSVLLFAVAIAADLTVTTTSDVTADDGLCSLREAVEAANNDAASGSTAGECGAGGVTDTITLPAGTYALDNGQLELDEPMNLIGAGSGDTIIDAQDLSRCIQSIVGGSLTIEGLTCRNGNSTGGAGGGMNFRDLISQVSQGNTLTLRDIVVEDCQTNEDGGGIATKGYALTTFDDVTLQRNYASDDGGGLQIEDSADPSAVAYDLSNVRILDNEANDDGGGAYFYLGDGASFEDWVIAGNVAGDRGGAVSIWGSQNHVTFRRASLVDNEAGGEGGAFFNSAPQLNLQNVLMTGNHADLGGVLYTEDDVDLDHVTAVGNTADSLGAGIFVYDFLSIKMRNSIFTDNSDGGSYAENCGALAYYWYYGNIFTSQGGNVLPTTGWACDVDPSDVLSDDPDLGTLTVGANGQYEYPTDLTSPARSLSDCLDTSSAAVSDDLLGEGRPASDCTSGAFQAEICGDGAITGDEACDDGDIDDGDGCSATCAIEDEYVCLGAPSACEKANDTDDDGWGDDLELLCGTDPSDDGSTPVDTDSDTICDPLDDDDDGDTWADALETLCGTDALDGASVPTDADLDGVCDDIDGDDDDDGWADDLEQLCGTDPFDDLDLPSDLDLDDVCDALDDDADGDGFLGSEETSCGTSDLSAASVPADSDSDGTCDLVDPCPADPLDDSDGDGSCDSVDLCDGDDTTLDGDSDGVCGDTDCDDGDDGRYPGAPEVCDGIDSDCDGTDELDGDNDGALSCEDCDDGDDTRYPGAYDAAADGVDANCDGYELCYVDGDEDGARSTTLVVSDDISCASAGLGLASAPYDCDDADDALEQVDGDNDGWSVCAGDCDDDDDNLVSCTDLQLSDASVPVAGELATFTVEGATPLSEVVLVRGYLGDTTSWSACATDLPLGEARRSRRWTTDALGHAVITKRMPPNAGLNGFAVIDPATCEVSNVITQEVFPSPAL